MSNLFSSEGTNNPSSSLPSSSLTTPLLLDDPLDSSIVQRTKTTTMAKGSSTTTTTTKTSLWPDSVAQSVKLLIPVDYNLQQPQQSQQSSSPNYCYIQYDVDQNVFVIVPEDDDDDDDDNNNDDDQQQLPPLDVIDPNDMIGVRIEIELSDTTTNTTTTDSTTMANNNANNNNIDNNNDRDSNEPSTDVPIDTQGCAILTLFVYPRRDLSQQQNQSSCRVWNWWKSSTTTSTNSSSVVQQYLDQRQPNNATTTTEGTTTIATSPKYGHRYAHHRRFIVAPSEDLTHLNTLVDAIRQMIRPSQPQSQQSQSQQSRRLFVLANPMAGSKSAVSIYHNTVKPMLEQANDVEHHDFIVTTHSKHAQQLVSQQQQQRGADNDDNDDDTDNGDTNPTIHDLSYYTGIVTIGGDGIVHEVMQGIHSRTDCDQILSQLQFGMVGAGTSNGLSATLAHASDEQFSPTDSTFLIAKGKTSPMDLSLYQTSSQSYMSFLTFSWAIIADIDIESEAIHWLGFLRMDLWGALRTVFLRRYRAKFWYLPPPPSSTTTDTQNDDNTKKTAVTLPPITEPIIIPDSSNDDDNDTDTNTDNNSNDRWVYCEDDFILFWASQVTHAGEKMYHSPPCQMDDGLFHIFIVRGHVSRFRLALILLTMEHGGHVEMDGVEFIECVAYRLEPITSGSFNDLDGEVIESGIIQGTVLPSAIQAYADATSTSNTT